jgi:hypothetical protein
MVNLAQVMITGFMTERNPIKPATFGLLGVLNKEEAIPQSAISNPQTLQLNGKDQFDAQSGSRCHTDLF